MKNCFLTKQKFPKIAPLPAETKRWTLVSWASKPQPTVYVSDGVCVACLFICCNFFSQSNYLMRPGCYLSFCSTQRLTITIKLSVSEVIFSIECSIEEKVNLLWLIVKITRIKGAFGNCYLHICLEIVNPRDTGWVWGSKLVICHQKGKALKVI